MDKIQKVLIEQGRKDLAQQYYLKLSNSDWFEKLSPEKQEEYKKKHPNSIHSIESLKENFKRKKDFEKRVDQIKTQRDFEKRVKQYKYPWQETNVVESSLKGLHKNIINDLLRKKIGEDSKWISAKLTRKVDTGIYGIFEKGKDFPIFIIKTDYSDKFEIRNPKTNDLLSGNRGLNLKGVREWFESKNIDIDTLDVKTPSPIEIKEKKSWGEGERNYEGKYSVYDANGRTTWVSKAEFDRIMREREMNKPLKDIKDLKKDIFKDRFMKSIPKLESLVSTITGYDLKANVKGTVTNSKFFSIDFTPSFFGKDLGVFKFALSDASFSTYCNPTPEKEKIWFPLSLNWNHIKGGSNGGTTYNLGGKSINLFYTQATGEWEEDRS